MREGTDFTVYEIPGSGYHWEGKGNYEDYCSEEGFATEAACRSDAVAFLASL